MASPAPELNLEWQINASSIIMRKPDRRTLHWFWEPTGRWEVKESILDFVNPYVGKGDALYFHKDSAGTVKSGVAKWIASGKPLKVVFYRCDDRQLQRGKYEFIGSLECVLDGIMRHRTKQVAFNPPHVICFANMEPDTSTLSQDRWHIERIQMP